jgi:rubrerythrin
MSKHEQVVRGSFLNCGPRRIAELDAALTSALSAAREDGRREGFEKAQDNISAFLHSEQARDFLGGYAPVGKDLNQMVRWLDRRIRAMRDGAGGEGCRACGHVFHDDNKCPGCTANGTQCIRDDS